MMAIIMAVEVASLGLPTERQSQFIRRPSRISESTKSYIYIYIYIYMYVMLSACG